MIARLGPKLETAARLRQRGRPVPARGRRIRIFRDASVRRTTDPKEKYCQRSEWNRMNSQTDRHIERVRKKTTLQAQLQCAPRKGRSGSTNAHGNLAEEGWQD